MILFWVAASLAAFSLIGNGIAGWAMLHHPYSDVVVRRKVKRILFHSNVALVISILLFISISIF